MPSLLLSLRLKLLAEWLLRTKIRLEAATLPPGGWNIMTREARARA